MTTTLVVDLAAHDDDLGAAAASGWRLAAGSRPVTLIVVEGGFLAGQFAREPLALVPVRSARSPRALGWGTALQGVLTDDVVLISGPADAPTAWPKWQTGTVELASATGGTVHAGVFLMADYARVRGFDTHLGTPGELVGDLLARIAALDTVHTSGAAETAPVRNLPVWAARPGRAAPIASVLIVGSGCGNRQDETILAAQAQSVDDVDIHLVDLTGDTFGADWVAQHSVQPRPRYGSWGTVTRHDISGDRVAGWRGVIDRLQGEWTLLLGADDIALPWALESALRHLAPHGRAITGVRVGFGPEGSVAPTADADLPRVACVATSLLRRWWPTDVSSVTELAEAVIGRRPQPTPVAMSLTAVAELRAGGGAWRTPWARGVESLRACLPDRFGFRTMVLRRNCVQKVDELDAYDRCEDLVAEFDANARLVHESLTLTPCGWHDFALLSRGGHAFEAFLGPGAGADELDRATGRRLAALPGASRRVSDDSATGVAASRPAGGWIVHRSATSGTRTFVFEKGTA